MKSVGGEGTLGGMWVDAVEVRGTSRGNERRMKGGVVV